MFLSVQTANGYALMLLTANSGEAPGVTLRKLALVFHLPKFTG